ncbi:MAG: hypothetical protein H0U81_13300 [Pyrinomonadaceae bacterium]|jgi:predicted O-methyltransferase YrrM|nr:hypothetical protein [Pyrinomonadaceae bacterium]MDQ3256232.1 class I SAM-dependent methyltransferase [Acidobacteriota bacterium]
MIRDVLKNFTTEHRFAKAFHRNLADCDWTPHPRYSVFTQYDASFYVEQKEAFLHKYKCFWAVSKTIQPKRIVELGTHAGSSADAYLSATPTAHYVGVDKFCMDEDIRREDDGRRWQPLAVANALFEARGFRNYEFISTNLRSLDTLPCKSDFVVVDAAHDFDNQYADMKLALTAEPTFIFVDDVSGEAEQAVNKFLAEDSDRVAFACPIEYVGGGSVIKMNT